MASGQLPTLVRAQIKPKCWISHLRIKDGRLQKETPGLLAGQLLQQATVSYLFTCSLCAHVSSARWSYVLVAKTDGRGYRSMREELWVRKTKDPVFSCWGCNRG